MARTRVPAHFSATGRLVAVLALFAFVGIAAFRIEDAAGRRAEARRPGDQLAWAGGLAQSVSRWLEDAQRQSQDLASRTADAQAIESHLASPARFGSSVLVVDAAMRVRAASNDHAADVGRVPTPCVWAGAADGGFSDLVRDARRAGRPVLSGVIHAPGVGGCNAAIAAASANRESVVVLMARVEEISRHLPSSPRVVLLDRARTSIVEAGLGAEAAPAELRDFVAAANGRSMVGSRPAGGRRFIDAVANVGRTGWVLVVEQDAAVFDTAPTDRVAVYTPLLVEAILGFVLVLVVLLEIRRRRAAARADVAKDAFLSIAGHELRTPLTVLGVVSEMLSERWTELDDDQRRSLIDRLLPQARRLRRTIERVLVSSNIQAGTLAAPVLQAVDVSTLLEEAADQLRPEAPLHRFVVEARPGLPRALADPRALGDVLEHLLDNAVKYSPSGGTVWIRASGGRGAVEIAIEDEGVGLPASTSRIFGPFEQGESVDKRLHDEGGAGLGLFIVRTLVTRMRGAVRAERRSPRGARFVVQLRTAVPSGRIRRIA